MLKGEGTSEGFYANDKNQIEVNKDGKAILMDLMPWRSHWVLKSHLYFT